MADGVEMDTVALLSSRTNRPEFLPVAFATDGDAPGHSVGRRVPPTEAPNAAIVRFEYRPIEGAADRWDES
jgi:hypothetical protein